jgi:diketogulonate reductase-like aldo/keto reductase
MLVYANEQYVGAAIRESGLARQDVWITTKYDGGEVLETVHTSLRKVRSSAVRGIHIYLSLPPFGLF